MSIERLPGAAANLLAGRCPMCKVPFSEEVDWDHGSTSAEGAYWCQHEAGWYREWLAWMAERAEKMEAVVVAARRLRDPVNGRASDLFDALDALDALP